MSRVPHAGLSRPIPAGAGIGLRFPHLAELEQSRPDVALLELHTENLFGLSPALHRRLERLRADYPYALHGVGLSLGSADGLDPRHLRQIRNVIRRYEPALVSEHLCWNRAGGLSLPELLPLPLIRESLDIVCRNVDCAQNALGLPIAIENISAYLRYEGDELSEAAFMHELVARTGCGLLVDLNNLHVNQLNLGESPLDFLTGIPAGAVAEFHLAGAARIGGAWIDTHSAPVAAEVWDLYRLALERLGPRATIVEWDQDLPALPGLVAEARRADALLRQACREDIAA